MYELSWLLLTLVMLMGWLTLVPLLPAAEAAISPSKHSSYLRPYSVSKVARWQNLIPSFPWIAPGWRVLGGNPRKGRDQILQRSVAEP